MFPALIWQDLASPRQNINIAAAGARRRENANLPRNSAFVASMKQRVHALRIGNKRCCLAVTDRGVNFLDVHACDGLSESFCCWSCWAVSISAQPRHR
jgi:hypothetical protein